MRINIISLLLSIAIAALIAYTFYASEMEDIKSVLIGLLSSFYLGTAFAFTSKENQRSSTLIRIIGITSTVVMIIINIIYNIADVKNHVFYITNFMILILSLLVMYKLFREKL